MKSHGIVKENPTPRSTSSDISSILTKSCANSYTSKQDKQEKVNELTVSLVIKDKLPISIVESESLRKLLRVCWPDYKPVSCKFISNAIKHKADSVRQQIRNAVGSNIVSITTDHWTRNSCQNYQGLTMHWIDVE